MLPVLSVFWWRHVRYETDSASARGIFVVVTVPHVTQVFRLTKALEPWAENTVHSAHFGVCAHNDCCCSLVSFLPLGGLIEAFKEDGSGRRSFIVVLFISVNSTLSTTKFSRTHCIYSTRR